MSHYNTEVVHVSEEEFKRDVAAHLQNVEIKGRVVQVHNEDGNFAFLVPDWMMRDFIREKIGLKSLEEPNGS